MIFTITHDDGRTEQRESVSIPSLSIGDVVCIPHSSGVRVRLTKRYDYADCVSFATEYVDGQTDGLGQYGRDMRDGKWRIQGNQYAHISRCI